ncbi:MAG TPA: enoyl-CoA hydratase [Solirubrobacteraceae bacterium]|nr:enoyl-CoA hydratase [Solirubrobacteraceae bacterium]
MTAHHIELHREGAVATILVNRPEARNALTAAMRGRLLELFEELNGARDVRVVVLRGAGGKSFISGADITEFRQQSPEDVLELARRDEQLYQAMERLRAPSVAAIEGYALGGGLMLAAICDLRVCSDDSRLGITSAKSLGNALSAGMYARLAALLGVGRVKEMLIGSEVLDAGKARAWGLVNEVHPRAEFDDRLRALTERLSTHAPLTMWAAKESMRRLTGPLPDEDDVLRTVAASEDFREGVAAFMEKRPPRWQNR